MDPLELLPIPLLEWFRDNARRLPWRDDPTPYHVWLSEIMLQQTRVAAVLDYYQRFLAAAPDIAALAALPEDRLMKLWQGLGYYSRARNLQKAAKVIVERYGGRFPEDYAAVRALPGVGDYTAGAICSIAFGLTTPAVDGNVLRVYVRLRGDGGDITTPQMKRKVTQEIERVIPIHAAGTFNQALMELGATVCLPNGAPLCDRCPAQRFCAALVQNRVDELPVKAPKRPRRVEERTVWLIFHHNRVALRRRPAQGLLAGLWEFPHELGDDPLPADWGISTLSDEYTGQAKHIFTHIEWHMTLRMVETETDALPPGWVWADKCELERQYAVPNAFDQALKQAVERMKVGKKAMICSLCPRKCGALRDEEHGEGRCGMPSLPVCARAALHRWEEPCLTGPDGAGTVFFSGCTLSCVFCQNEAISHGKYGRTMTENELYAVFKRLAEQGAACVELVTPTQFSHVLARVLERPVPGGLPVVWNSGGYERVETLRALEGKVDVYLPDLKYVTPALAEKYSGAADYPDAAKAAILEMYRQRGPVRLENGLLKSGVLIRHLVLPGQVSEARRVMDWVASTFPSGAVLFSLLAQYTPVGELDGFPELRRPLRPSELRTAREYMENLGLAGYAQELGSVGEEFIPAFDLTGL